ncbi:MAG: DUF4159 domain-containing protein, partial [bacterium]|nr:DUF4159 domain-containing protein [bacterium]
MAKLRYGQKKAATTPDGQTYDYYDWKSDPGDAAALLKFAGPRLGIRYREQIVGPQLAKVDPRENAILYVTGHQRPEVPDDAARLIRDFTLTGGTIFADACCGSPPFTEGFLEFMEQIFPERRFAPLAPDHALYRAFFPVQQVTFKEGQKVTGKGPPELYGMELGCRTAVIFTRHDFSCGWDSHEHDVGGRIDAHDAMRMGTNMLAYTLANQELGRFLSTTKTYYEKHSEPGADEFVFGQLMHDGDWDP